MNWLNLSAAVLGAGFYSLFTAYQYVANRTFEPGYNVIYLVRFFLGIVSGMVLANFGKDFGLTGTYTPAMLGVIGGYSAEAVNQILLRISEILVAAVKGSSKEDFTQKESLLRAEARDEKSRLQQRTSVELSDVLNEAIANGAPKNVIDRIRKSIDLLKN